MRDFNFNVGAKTYRVVKVADYMISPVGGKRVGGVHQIGQLAKNGEGHLHLQFLSEPLIESDVQPFIDGMRLMEQLARTKELA